MKFRIDRDLLNNHINSVSSIVPVKPVVSVIANILIEAHNNKIILSATDFEITIQSEIMDNLLEIKNTGHAVVNAKTISSLIKTLPQGMLDIEVVNEEMIIKHSTGTYKLNTLKREDYVEIIGIDKKKLFTVESLPIVNAIDNTRFAASKDSIKIALTGILMEANGKELSFVGTDGHRLSLYKIKDIFEKPLNKTLIIPPKALEKLKTLIENQTSFEMGFEEKRIMFKIGDTEISAKLIEGQYPDYKRVIPMDNNKLLIVNKKTLIEAINRVNIFTNPNTKLIKFYIDNNKLNINAHQSQTGEGNEVIDCEYNDEEVFQIGFNSMYLLEMLKKIETDNVKIKMKTDMSAVIIENEESKIGEESLFIIMPLRLK